MTHWGKGVNTDSRFFFNYFCTYLPRHPPHAGAPLGRLERDSLTRRVARKVIRKPVISDFDQAGSEEFQLIASFY